MLNLIQHLSYGCWNNSDIHQDSMTPSDWHIYELSLFVGSYWPTNTPLLPESLDFREVIFSFTNLTRNRHAVLMHIRIVSASLIRMLKQVQHDAERWSCLGTRRWHNVLTSRTWRLSGIGISSVTNLIRNWHAKLVYAFTLSTWRLLRIGISSVTYLTATVMLNLFQHLYLSYRSWSLPHRQTSLRQKKLRESLCLPSWNLSGDKAGFVLQPRAN